MFEQKATVVEYAVHCSLRAVLLHLLANDMETFFVTIWRIHQGYSAFVAFLTVQHETR